MRVAARLLVVAAFAGSLALPGTALAAAPLSCRPAPGNAALVECRGTVASPDGAASLDVSVTLPARPRAGLPLVLLLDSGSELGLDFVSRSTAGSGLEFHNNARWYASQGIAALTLSGRGHGECLDESVDAADSNPALYSVSPACGLQLAHVRHEIEDLQYLAGRMVDGTLTDEAPPTSPEIGVVGASYGGGQAWLLARQSTWRSVQGTSVRVAAAAPIAGWTDLVDALLPNGRASDLGAGAASDEQRAAQRVGVRSALASSFLRQGLAVDDLPAYLATWRERFLEGEPLDEDDVVADAIEGLLTQRSAYFVRGKRGPSPAIFSAQGFTDPLFPASQSLAMYNSLRDDDERYPIEVYLGDIGHSPARNPASETRSLGRRVGSWMIRLLNGGRPDSRVSARVSTCDEKSGDLYSARTWDALSGEDYQVPLSLDGRLSNPARSPHAATLASGVRGGGCITTSDEVGAGNIAASSEVPGGGLTMLGLPRLTLTAEWTAPHMYVAAHLWDVAPSGTQTLVTRGIYRLGAFQSPELVNLKLFGNAYEFAEGHSIKLELTADDSPSFARSNGRGSIEVSDLELSLPLAEPAALVD